MKKPLFHKDFSLMIIGQIISIFGNSILRFALSLYILDLSGSATIFASILALSMLPTIFLSPFGGMLSDRMSRKMIMVVLDFTTSILIVLFALLIHSDHIVILIGGFMVLLSLIQSFYQPSVQASIPSITDSENLTSANSVVTQINASSMLLGPILGGLFYGFFGIEPILWISSSCFLISAILEIFLHIPFVKQERTTTLLQTVKEDFQIAIDFIVHKNPLIFKMLLMMTGLNLFLTAMLQVGLPYLLKIRLALSSQLYGFAESSLAIGMIIGSILAMKIADRLTFQRSHSMLLLGSTCLLPIGLSTLSTASPMLSYAIIVVSILAGMSFISVFNVMAQTYMQVQTPDHLLGKVASFITTICMCAVPIGQAIYGLLFDAFPSLSPWIVVLACIFGIILSIYAKSAISKLKDAVA